MDFPIDGLGNSEFTVLVVFPNQRTQEAVGDCEFPCYSLDKYFPWIYLCDIGVTEWACMLFGRGGVCESSHGTATGDTWMYARETSSQTVSSSVSATTVSSAVQNGYGHVSNAVIRQKDDPRP